MKARPVMVLAAAMLVGAATPAFAAKGTVGVPGCSVSYDTGTFALNPSTGQVTYGGPSFSADTSSCIPETPPRLG